MTPSWLLKLGATALSLLATFGAAVFVSHHVKNPDAPLRPQAQQGQFQVAPGGRLVLTPSVHSADVKPVTSTYAS
jgi:hypothetical protein